MQEGVLHELLADRRAAAGEAILPQVDLEAPRDLAQVEAGVVPKPRVFGRHQRATNVAGQGAERDPIAQAGADRRARAIGKAVLDDPREATRIDLRRIGDHLAAVVEGQVEAHPLTELGVEIDGRVGPSTQRAADDHRV
jgi:hypothetical protein